MEIRRVTLEIEGITISGQLYLPGGRDTYPVVCICHGIPSGKPRAPGDGGYPALAEQICREGFLVSILNFRGTGDSGGNLDLPGWTRDLEAVIDHLWSLPEVDKVHLSLLGFSGGAAVAIYVAAQDKRVSSVAACASPADFESLFDAGQPQAMVDYFRGIGTIRDADFPSSAEEWLRGFYLVSPIKYVAGIAPRPLLLVHDTQDKTIDIDHAYRLYANAGEPRKIVVSEGAGHRLRLDGRVMDAVLDWLKQQCLN